MGEYRPGTTVIEIDHARLKRREAELEQTVERLWDDRAALLAALRRMLPGPTIRHSDGCQRDWFDLRACPDDLCPVWQARQAIAKTEGKERRRDG